eukprot:CCRYP_019656-RA/>CCRYP_019656-RA protein AED:0.12 eAED:0.12 QI:495/1/1/1/1/1/2/2046/525
MEHGQKEFHIAPMLDVSTIEFRHFMRLLTKRAILWTEMVVAETLVYRSEHNSVDDDDIQLDPELIRHCGWFDERDHYDYSAEDPAVAPTMTKDEVVDPHPIVCQIGTNDPRQAAFATRVARACGYDRIDLNAECPSDRVAGREFGAALMRDHDTATQVVRSMVDASASCKQKSIPVSVKTRIGVDDFDSFEHLAHFIQRLVDAGCRHFVMHARKVYTQGLMSPAQNRTVPPLDYPCVYRLIEHFPQCDFWLNGGIMNLEHARKIAFGQAVECCGDEDHATSFHDKHFVPCENCSMPHGSCIAPPPKNLPNLRGVMVGRLARDNPSALADVDRYFYGESSNPCNNRRELLEKYIQFIEKVYPRRCCDDNDEIISSRMVMDVEQKINHYRPYCDVCREFSLEVEAIIDEEPTIEQTPSEVTINNVKYSRDAHQKHGKRRKRHFLKNEGAKIVSGIIDSAIQPTLGILFGQRGNSQFRRELHRLSRDMTVRNCGAGYMLKRAMACIPPEVWDRPFELNESLVSYIPSK